MVEDIVIIATATNEGVITNVANVAMEITAGVMEIIITTDLVITGAMAIKDTETIGATRDTLTAKDAIVETEDATTPV